MLKLLVTLILSTLLYAESLNNRFSDQFLINLNLSYVVMDRSILGADSVVDSKVNPILNATIGVTLFPSTYNLSLGYTHNITTNVDDNLYNPYQYDDNVEHYFISAKPYYNEKFGGVGIFYTFASQNSSYQNKLSTTMMIGKYGRDWTQPSGWNLVKQYPSIQPQQTFQSKEKASYLGIKYLFPKYKYIPKGSNVFYSIMDRTTVYYSTLATNHYLIYMSGKGKMYGCGLQRELYELPNNQVSLDLVQISQGIFSDFPKIKLNEFSAGLTYKRDNLFVKLFALVYISNSYDATLNSQPLHIPATRDIMATIRFGTSF